MKKIIGILVGVFALSVILIVCLNVYPWEQAEVVKEDRKVAFLTFDDGPSRNTAKVLRILDRYDVKATFFVIGSQITDDYVDLLSKMQENGHSIGIHTFSHKYREIYLSTDSYIKDFEKSKSILDSFLKKKSMIYRFPGGSCNCFIGCKKQDIIDILSKKGYRYYDWNVSGEDSVNYPSVNSIVNNVVKDYKNFDKPIILLHDGPSNGNTVKALPTIIEVIKKSGYVFGTL